MRLVWPGRPTFDRAVSDFDRLRGEMLRLLDGGANDTAAVAGVGVFPPVNVSQDDNNYYIRAERERSETSELSKAPEQTRPGPVYTPAADIFESEETITLLADLPGVAASELTIDLRDSVLTLTGRARVPTEGKESPLLREYATGTFYRQFTLSDTIDQSKIDAKIVDGVLRLELPKAERAKPRRINVKSA